jgi:hypothetical protein
VLRAKPKVDDALYGVAQRDGLVADDGERQCWATIRSGLSAVLIVGPPGRQG